MTDPVRVVANLQTLARGAGYLSVWAIYDHPTDHPEDFIARMHLTNGDGVEATNNTLRTVRLETLQRIFTEAGLTRFTRQDEDDPCIVETWL